MDKQETINRLTLAIAMIEYVNAELDRLLLLHIEAANKMKITDN